MSGSTPVAIMSQKATVTLPGRWIPNEGIPGKVPLGSWLGHGPW